jgi:hypothetical protein
MNSGLASFSIPLPPSSSTLHYSVRVSQRTTTKLDATCKGVLSRESHSLAKVEYQFSLFVRLTRRNWKLFGLEYSVHFRIHRADIGTSTMAEACSQPHKEHTTEVNLDPFPSHLPQLPAGGIPHGVSHGERTGNTHMYSGRAASKDAQGDFYSKGNRVCESHRSQKAR